jgi:hypothetical protein
MKYILYYSFSFVVRISLAILFFINYFKTKKKEFGILALPYYPKNWPGGEERVAAWQPYFEKNGKCFNVIFSWEKTELESFLIAQSKNKLFAQYKLYYKLLFRRIKIFLTVENYETIWIQRSFVPLFPFKDAFFEKKLAKVHKNIIYDFYDADYESNFKLIMNAVCIANKITVASKFLEKKFTLLNPNTYLIRFALPFKIRKDYTKLNKEVLKIGWMGSPENAENLKLIEDDLIKLEESFPNIKFSFVCRHLPTLNLKSLESFNFNNAKFNYNKWIQSIDIGIVPFKNIDERTKAKISMKSLEFMSYKIPMVCSPFVHSDMLEPDKSFILAKNNWYDPLALLIKNEELRIEMSKNAFNIFNKYHTYSQGFPLLNEVLINKCK